MNETIPLGYSERLSGDAVVPPDRYMSFLHGEVQGFKLRKPLELMVSKDTTSGSLVRYSVEHRLPSEDGKGKPIYGEGETDMSAERDFKSNMIEFYKDLDNRSSDLTSEERLQKQHLDTILERYFDIILEPSSE